MSGTGTNSLWTQRAPRRTLRRVDRRVAVVLPLYKLKLRT